MLPEAVLSRFPRLVWGVLRASGSIRQFCSHPRHRRSHRPLARPTIRLIQRRDPYSTRSTITGSMRDARPAGIAAAITATATTTSGTMMNVIGSVALTP